MKYLSHILTIGFICWSSPGRSEPIFYIIGEGSVEIKTHVDSDTPEAMIGKKSLHISGFVENPGLYLMDQSISILDFIKIARPIYSQPGYAPDLRRVTVLKRGANGAIIDSNLYDIEKMTELVTQGRPALQLTGGEIILTTWLMIPQEKKGAE